EIPAPARVELDDPDGDGGWRGHPAILVALAPVVARRQRPRPTVVGRDEAALEAMELFGTRLDPEALRQRTPALAVVAVPLLGDVAAGATDDVADRAGVVDVARGPALVGQQHGDVVARRVVVAHQLVHERVPVAIAVIVD